jgi:hypothetical protein
MVNEDSNNGGVTMSELYVARAKSSSEKSMPWIAWNIDVGVVDSIGFRCQLHTDVTSQFSVPLYLILCASREAHRLVLVMAVDEVCCNCRSGHCLSCRWWG